MSRWVPSASLSLGVAALALAGLHPIANIDTFGHLAQGRHHATSGLGTADPFGLSATATRPWYNYEWLFDVGLWAVYTTGGFDALVVMKLLMLAAVAAVLVHTAHVHGRDRGAAIAAGLLVWAVPTVRFRLSMRPHLVGMLLGAVYVHGLLSIAREDRDAKQRWRWVGALGLLHVVWVNAHGSHLLGLLLTLLFAATTLRTPSLRKPFGVLVGLELVASCISPYGPRIALDAVSHVLDPAYRALVPEWAPWSAHQPVWIAIGFGAHMLLGVLALGGLRRSVGAPWAATGVLLLLAVMGARSVRFIGEAVLLTTPLVAIGLAALVGKLPTARAWVAAAALVGSGALAAIPLARTTPPHLPIGLGSDTYARPAASAAWLAKHAPRARLFSTAEDGWFALFGAPGVRVYMDGRFPYHGVAHSMSVPRAITSPAALTTLLDARRIDAVILEHSATEQRAALATLTASPDWSLVVAEQHHALFVRGAHPETLTALTPSYDPSHVLGPSVDRAALARDLERLASYPNADAFSGWVGGLLALEPTLRDAGAGGLFAPSPARIAKGEEALAQLAPVADRLRDVQTLAIHAAMAAVAACRLDTAEHWLERAAASGETREHALLSLEIRLRRGGDAEVRAEAARALAVPGLEADAWLGALGRAAPARCP